MKLIALILGLGLEHLATQLLHLRELRWLDPYFDIGLRRLRASRPWSIYLGSVVVLILPLIPVLWASVALRGTTIPWDLPYLLFAVLVVFFCLGPRDLGTEVEEYCEAVGADDAKAAETVFKELTELEHSGASEIEAVEEAIFVQATNRIFGVIFWFIVFGPVGAWMFRVSDLFRRRAAFVSGRDAEAVGDTLPAIEAIHGVLVWIPARLATIGYALSGHFDDALDCWRSFERDPDLPFHRSNDQIVACVGKAAMALPADQTPDSAVAAKTAMRLVTRTVFVWVTIIAIMTIFGWAV